MPKASTFFKPLILGISFFALHCTCEEMHLKVLAVYLSRNQLEVGSIPLADKTGL